MRKTLLSTLLLLALTAAFGRSANAATAADIKKLRTELQSISGKFQDMKNQSTSNMFAMLGRLGEIQSWTAKELRALGENTSEKEVTQIVALNTIAASFAQSLSIALLAQMGTGKTMDAMLKKGFKTDLGTMATVDIGLAMLLLK